MAGKGVNSTKKSRMGEVTAIKKHRLLLHLGSMHMKAHGIKLPGDFRSFLLRSNVIDIKERVIREGEREFHIHRFFPFNLSGELSL